MYTILESLKPKKAYCLSSDGFEVVLVEVYLQKDTEKTFDFILVDSKNMSELYQGFNKDNIKTAFRLDGFFSIGEIEKKEVQVKSFRKAWKHVEKLIRQMQDAGNRIREGSGIMPMQSHPFKFPLPF